MGSSEDAQVKYISHRISTEYQKKSCYTVYVFTAVIHEEDGIFVAECPEVGSVSQGTSVEEALSNLREAKNLYSEEFSQK